MCGIVGYIGNKFADSVLVVGLERLEYRGYDSAGIATIFKGELGIRKKKGRIKVLDDYLDELPLGGTVGIGHTRWATHGEPSDKNAHPLTDCKKQIAVVHNGIIENYVQLKESLAASGHIFESETDTEVIPHLIESHMNGKKLPLEDAVRATLAQLKGAFAMAVISEREPDKIVVARMGSPLIVGIGKGENFVASDVPALSTLTKKVVYLNDGEMGILTKMSAEFTDFAGNPIDKKVEEISIETAQIDKGKYQFFMLKEIYEQPEIVEKIIKNRVKSGGEIDFDEMKLSKSALLRVRRVIIQACGTSWHSGLIAKYWLEKYARILTEVDISSEFRYRNPIVEGDTLMIAISQSGETADTLAGVREGKSKFLKALSFVNVVNSTIARESDGIIPILAGPEIGVASTKAYTAQLVSLYLFAIYLGQLNYTITEDEARARIDELKKAPALLQKILDNQDTILKLSEGFYQCRDFIFLGRGINYPNALEGALKLKEISYIHATGYPAGEFKHGPIALVNEHMPVVCITPQGSIYPKMLNNIEEVAARKGIIISVATEGDKQVAGISRHVIYVPECPEDISPVVTALPLQLLAYHIAVKLGLDVDRPRNLAKSVTVE